MEQSRCTRNSPPPVGTDRRAALRTARTHTHMRKVNRYMKKRKYEEAHDEGELLHKKYEPTSRVVHIAIR